MRTYPTSQDVSGLENRLALLVEGRRSERIIKLHWLARRRDEVRRFLREVSAEVRALELELRRDWGMDGEELRDIEKSADAARRAAQLSPALRSAAK